MRMTEDLTIHRYACEDDQALLGSARVYLDLVGDRINAQLQMIPSAGILAPALDDLRQAQRLIKRAQRNIASRTPSPRAAQEPGNAAG